MIEALMAMALATAPAGQTPRAVCGDLAGFKIEAARIGLPTTGAQVATAVADPAGVCVVRGAIAPVDPAAPPINFQINLPAAWNGKAVQVGGGGYNGFLVSGRSPAFLPKAREPVTLGYATFGSDSGHQGGGGDPRAAPADASFAMNEEAWINFGHAQIKKTRDVAVAVMVRFYGAAPRRLYFYGNSQGGHEGLIAAQRFPADYDGVVSIHPAYNFTALQLSGLNLARHLYAPGAWISPAKTRLIGDAVVAKCDDLDGLADGVVSDVATCRAVFDVRTLQCPGGADADGCLSAAQVEAAIALSQPTRFGMVISGGDTFGGWPILEGAFGKGSFFGLGFRPVPGKPPTGQDAFGFLMADQGVRYMMVRDPAYDSLAFEPKQHRAAVARSAELVDASSDDLDRFRARGGKLLLMHGTVDMAIPPSNSVAYYQRLSARYGAALPSFLRFYIAPGFGHGDGPFPVSWSSLDALDRWVETGQGPGPQTVVDASPVGGGRARPLCEFPRWPRYDGKGDPRRAESFACVN